LTQPIQVCAWQLAALPPCQHAHYFTARQHHQPSAGHLLNQTLGLSRFHVGLFNRVSGPGGEQVGYVTQGGVQHLRQQRLAVLL